MVILFKTPGILCLVFHDNQLIQLINNNNKFNLYSAFQGTQGRLTRGVHRGGGRLKAIGL